MFNSLLGQAINQDFRLRQESFRNEAVSQGEAAKEQDIFIPDDRLGLIIQNGIPVRILAPGRHLLNQAKAKIEVRLISIDVLLDQAPQRLLQNAQELPFEKAFRFVDGGLVSIVKPEASRRLSPGRLTREEFPSRELLRRHLHVSSSADEDEEFAQDFSFI